jgi:hypothetical protein
MVRTASYIFPHDIKPAPRSYAEAFVDVREFIEHDAGGHFAAWDSPRSTPTTCAAPCDWARETSGPRRWNADEVRPRLAASSGGLRPHGEDLVGGCSSFAAITARSRDTSGCSPVTPGSSDTSRKHAQPELELQAIRRTGVSRNTPCMGAEPFIAYLLPNPRAGPAGPPPT